MENTNKLQDVLTELYSFLRDEGFSIHSQAIKKLLIHLKKNEIKVFKKEMKSAIISGGAGSVRDIDFIDKGKSLFFNNMLETVNELIKEI